MLDNHRNKYKYSEYEDRKYQYPERYKSGYDSKESVVSDPDFDEFLKLVGRDSVFGDKFIAEQGIRIESECSLKLWAFFIFASDKDNRKNLVSNLCDMAKARSISIKLDLNSDASIDKIGKFLTTNYPLSAGRKISFQLPNEGCEYAQEKLKEFKESCIPKEQHEYFSIIPTDHCCPGFCFESSAVVKWKEPVEYTSKPKMCLRKDQGEIYVDEKLSSAVIDIGSGKCVYFSHDKITDKTVGILREEEQHQRKSNDSMEYFIKSPTYSLEFNSDNFVLRKMQQGEVVTGHASLSALFKITSDIKYTFCLYGAEFSHVTIKEKRSLNHINASAASIMGGYYESGDSDELPPERTFDYKESKMLYVRVVDVTCNTEFDIEINVEEFKKIPVISEVISDNKGKKHICSVRKKNDGKIKTENIYGDIMCEVDKKGGIFSSIVSQQPSTSLSNSDSNACDNSSLMK